MKVLSVAVPCYNSEDYMEQCINSLLAGGEEIEIIVVNDGSTEGTADIANRYMKQYPSIVKAVHQENGGHGESINTGLKYAQGYFFKVVDSDDWVDEQAYLRVLEKLKDCVESSCLIDMLVSNFIYEKQGARHKKIMRYTHVFPENEVFTWNDMGRFKKGQYLLMHSVIYRTQLLKSIGLRLPKHTFYVDNLFVYLPLQAVKTIYYMDVDFYHYFIGRADQSVNEQIMIKRIDQQIKVNKIMIEQVRIEEIKPKKLRKYLYHYLEIVTTVSSILLMRSGTKDNLRKKKELWKYIKMYDKSMYNRLRYRLLGEIINLPDGLSRSISVCIYKVSQKLVGFN